MAFSEPVKNLEIFGLQEGMVIADLGCGSGFYTIEAAKHIKGGKIYAIDVQEDLLARLKNSLIQEHASSVELIHGDVEMAGGTKLKDRIADAAFVCNIFFQIEKEKEGDFLEELKRILKPTGRVLFIDWSGSFGGLGPHQDQVVPEELALELFKAYGFVQIKRFDAGDHHYGIIFRKQ